MNIEQAKRELKKKAFSFENSDSSLKNSTVWLKDVIEILDALSLLPVVSNNEVSVCDWCSDYLDGDSDDITCDKCKRRLRL